LAPEFVERGIARTGARLDLAGTMHPRLKLALDASEALYDAVETAASFAARELRRPRNGAYSVRRPGVETPLWNALADHLRADLRPWGAKARLARHLGIPRQRVNDFLHARSRLPDAEMALQLASWLALRRAARARK
jgi:hypothetical protein